MVTSMCSYGYAREKTMAQIDASLNEVRAVKNGGECPLIGITPTGTKENSVGKLYVDAVLRAGGVPVILAADTSARYLNDVVSRLDGVLLTGGVDVAPSYYGEAPIPQLGEVNDVRDVLELTVAKLAMRRNLPMFGICRGMQVINVAFGGTLYQDVPSQLGGDIEHRRNSEGERSKHMVSIPGATMLHSVLGVDSLLVNSSHHQAVKAVAKGAVVAAKSRDGVVEAIDFFPYHRVMAVQWHPEGFNGENEYMNKLFTFFVQQSKLYGHARRVHAMALSVDTHTDAPLEFDDGEEFGKRGKNRVNVPKMQEGMLDSQFLAAYVGSDKKVKIDGKVKRVARELNQATYDECHKRVMHLIDLTYEQASSYDEVCGIAYSYDDALRLKNEGKKAIFLGVENGIGIGEDLARLRELKSRGVKYVTLCHTYDNQICHSSTHTADASKGLTAFGKKMVKEMNRMGVIIDLSHASEGTFWDVIKLSKKPVICSHSGARQLCDNDRNITDEQLKALAKNGGVIQTVAYDDFLRSDGKATIEDFMKHLDYMVKVAGVDHVGIGTDFDGGGGVPGLQADNDMVNITMRLIEMGYSDSDIVKIWGGNFFRVMKEVEAVNR